ncbi:uncharacterized protein [Venturia canescens]|uniref:uncharacterized protein n=1 Tax=Venturia canescens TaxID=32260 RepID=UPI001C9C6D4E|nr:uncharacterized protein LOC122410310 [Venturia canescens]
MSAKPDLSYSTETSSFTRIDDHAARTPRQLIERWTNKVHWDRLRFAMPTYSFGSTGVLQQVAGSNRGTQTSDLQSQPMGERLMLRNGFTEHIMRALSSDPQTGNN